MEVLGVMGDWGCRTTVYLSTDLVDKIREDNLNLSQFIRMQLNEYFNRGENLSAFIAKLYTQLEGMVKDRESLQASENALRENIARYENRKKVAEERGRLMLELGLDKKEMMFLLNASEHTNLINHQKDFNSIFKKKLTFAEFAELVRKVKSLSAMTDLTN